MASFAKLNSENIVTTVVSVVNEVLKDLNGIEQENIGVEFLKSLYGQDTNWKQTSYNTNAGIHSLGGTPFRKNHAAIGYIYDSQRDAFISPKPFNSWILNETTCLWNSPVAYPVDSNINNRYKWNEEILNWELMNG